MRNFFKTRYGLPVVIGILTSIPLLLWATMEPLSARFENSTQGLTSVGQISALAGTVLFSVVIILRTKISAFSAEAVGITRNKSELLALLLLLAHPIIIMTTLIPESTTSAVSLLLPAGDWVLSFGVYALLLLLAYYAIQFCAGRNIYLKATPHVLAVVLFLGTLHAFFIPSDLSRNPILQTYMLAIIFGAMASYVYQVSAAKRAKKYLQTKRKEA